MNVENSIERVKEKMEKHNCSLSLSFISCAGLSDKSNRGQILLYESLEATGLSSGNWDF